MIQDDSNPGGAPGGCLPEGPPDDPRKRYAAPTVSDFGQIRRITQAGGAASTDDAFGTGMNMRKYTMIG